MCFVRYTLIHFTANPEAFIILHSHFIKTLATVNISQYILSIADWHLCNFMINLGTGGVTGIDFVHVFQLATQVAKITYKE